MKRINNIQSSKKMTAGDLIRLSKKLGLYKRLKNVDTAKLLKEVDRDFCPEDYP